MKYLLQVPTGDSFHDLRDMSFIFVLLSVFSGRLPGARMDFVPCGDVNIICKSPRLGWATLR